jgi:hypothetical protein
MANYEIITQRRPSFREFFLQRRLIHRGDVLFFPANYSSETFSTDGRGFRHTVFGGETLSVAEILKRERYGLVLGTSRSFGIGVEGNENTIPSLLSERFGFPFANVALPQGNSRNLACLFYSFLSRAPNRPSAVVHFSGGDLTGLAYTSFADPVFGSPNPKHAPIVEKEYGGRRPPEKSVNAMLAFTALWTQFIALTCRGQKIPMVLADDSNFFEKKEPSPADVEAQLGTPFHQIETFWFEGYKAFSDRFYERRAAVAKRLGIPLAGPTRPHDLGFIDEFHLDEDGTRTMAGHLGDALEPLLKKSK